MVQGKEAIRVTKDPAVKEFDEPTFAKLAGPPFKDGTIQVKVLSRLLKDAPEKYESYADMGLDEWIDLRIEVKAARAMLFVNGAKQPALIVNDLKHGTDGSGAIGLWVDVGTEGYFTDLRIRNE